MNELIKTKLGSILFGAKEYMLEILKGIWDMFNVIIISVITLILLFALYILIFKSEILLISISIILFVLKFIFDKKENIRENVIWNLGFYCLFAIFMFLYIEPELPKEITLIMAITYCLSYYSLIKIFFNGIEYFQQKKKDKAEKAKKEQEKTLDLNTAQ